LHRKRKWDEQAQIWSATAIAKNKKAFRPATFTATKEKIKTDSTQAHEWEMETEEKGTSSTKNRNITDKM
jgi:hypothetical protein